MPRSPRIIDWLALSATLAVALPAEAARPVEDHPGAELVLARGMPRGEPRASFAAPSDSAAWQAFLQSAGGTWRAIWDEDLGRPIRVWGSGVDAPGAVGSPEAAAAHARAMLAEHVGLLAPGSRAADFVVVGNAERNGVRSVGLQQLHGGLPVEGGQVSFRFKHDRLVAMGSEAFTNLDAQKPARVIGAGAAAAAAKRWVLESAGARGTVEAVEGPRVRAFVLDDGTVEAAPVLRVIVRTRAPVGRWAVDVHAGTGAPFARLQTLRFGAGQIAYRVPERRPGAATLDAPAAFANVTVAGQTQVLDGDGNLGWTDGATVTVEASVTGAGVVVQNEAGAPATETLVVRDGETAVWDPGEAERIAAQVTAFVHAYRVREYVRRIAPGLSFLDDPVQTTVNIADECNAYSDGVGIFFFASSQMCENTGRLPDVIHHEYGHSVHAHAIIPGVGAFDGAMSEGIADYLAATIASDAGMGRGFFYTDEPLRDLDPVGREWRWPEDQGEIHQTGQIIGGALWDLRARMTALYGEDAGVQIVDGFWYAALERATNILTVFPELLVEDDDDGDLSNGTPNLCLITEIFQGAGLTDGTLAGLSIAPPTANKTDAGWKVSMPVSASGLCPGLEFAGATLTWSRRGAADVGETLTMAYDGALASAELPPQPEGEVLLYRVQVELTNGDVRSYPDNPADPDYEQFLGEVRPIYCTDFEQDPIGNGWVSELLPSESRRPRNEWEWATPIGASGDPLAAFSGTHVVGNDLTDNGRYQGRKSEQLLTPAIDVSGLENVRLQYRRWLTVEDGARDQAQILVGEQQQWVNRSSATGTLNHEDREWRFHDVDLSAAPRAADGTMQVTFRISSDARNSFGGWTLDDFCLVTWDGPTAACGDGRLDYGEACDDGNDAARDGCEADCTLTPAPSCGDGFVDEGEQCDDGNAVDGDGCQLDCTPTPLVVDTPDLDTKDGCRCVALGAGPGALAWLLVGLAFVRRRRG